MKLAEQRKLFKEAQRQAKKFKGQKGIVDVEFGLKEKKGKITDEIALRFIVSKKRSASKVATSEVIPKKVGNFKTDVIDHKSIVKQYRTEIGSDIVRPLMGGIQILSELFENDVTRAGTFGYSFEFPDTHPGIVFGLTNYHVLLLNGLPEAFVLNNYVGKGVYQNDYGQQKRIGTTTRIFNEKLDYAVFTVEEPCDNLQSINGIEGRYSSYVSISTDVRVIKSGASTSITRGVLSGRSCFDCSELTIRPEPVDTNVNGIISGDGDSGSIWLTDNGTRAPIALHYGGSGSAAKAKSLASIFASITNKIRNQNPII